MNADDVAFLHEPDTWRGGPCLELVFRLAAPTTGPSLDALLPTLPGIGPAFRTDDPERPRTVWPLALGERTAGLSLYHDDERVFLGMHPPQVKRLCGGWPSGWSGTQPDPEAVARLAEALIQLARAFATRVPVRGAVLADEANTMLSESEPPGLHVEEGWLPRDRAAPWSRNGRYRRLPLAPRVPGRHVLAPALDPFVDPGAVRLGAHALAAVVDGPWLDEQGRAHALGVRFDEAREVLGLLREGIVDDLGVILVERSLAAIGTGIGRRAGGLDGAPPEALKALEGALHRAMLWRIERVGYVLRDAVEHPPTASSPGGDALEAARAVLGTRRLTEDEVHAVLEAFARHRHQPDLRDQPGRWMLEDELQRVVATWW